MFKLKLSCLHVEDSIRNTHELLNPDEDIPFEDCYEKDIIFYNIHNIKSYEYDNRDFTLISSGNSSYICTLPIKEVEELIDNLNK